MLFIELLFILGTLLFSLIGTVVMVRANLDSPIKELRLIIVGFFLLDLTYIFYLFIPLYSDFNNLNTDMIIFDRIGYFTSIFSILLFAYAFILPNFHLDYKDIFSLFILDLSCLSTAIYNSSTLTTTVIGNYIKTSYNAIGSLMTYTFYSILFILLINRIREILRILGKKYQSPILSIKYISFLGIWALVIMLVYGFLQFFNEIALPQYSYSILIGSLFLYVAIVVSKDRGFFFVTPAVLDAVIIIKQESGLTLYSKSFKKDLLPEDLLGSILSLLNISLQQALRSKEKLQQIRLGDKSVLIDTGDWVSTIMIVSESNFVTKSVITYLTKKFELFFKDNKEPTSSINLEIFHSFIVQIEKVRKFIPL